MLEKIEDSSDDGITKSWKSTKHMVGYIVGAQTVGSLFYKKLQLVIFKVCTRVPHFQSSLVYVIRNGAYNVGMLIYHLLRKSLKTLLHGCTGRNKSHPLF